MDSEFQGQTFFEGNEVLFNVFQKVEEKGTIANILEDISSEYSFKGVPLSEAEKKGYDAHVKVLRGSSELFDFYQKTDNGKVENIVLNEDSNYRVESFSLSPTQKEFASLVYKLNN